MAMRKTGIENYQENIAKMMEYFRSMDSKYYAELEGQPEDMAELTKFLDKVEI